MKKMMTMTKKERKELKRLATIELCRRDFFFYCKTLYPDFFKDEYWYLKDWCDKLQRFFENGVIRDTLIINAPPRHGKSFSLQLFTSWIIGKNYLKGEYKRIVVACYNQVLSIKFSTNVKSFMNMRQGENYIVYRDIFPGCKLAYGFDKKEEWRIEGAPESTFLSITPNSSITGFGVDLLIIDDMYKSISDVYSPVYADKLDTFVFSTLTTRFENEKKTIVDMTRWHQNDICQKIIDKTPKDKISINTYKLIDKDGKMLNESLFTKEDYEQTKKTMAPDVLLANYQQEFIFREGSLYKNLKTYDKLPEKDENGNTYQYPIMCVADIADKGSDFLCCIFYTYFKNAFFVTDIIYTDKRMAETEKIVAERILKNNCMYFLGEGNNGGSTYVRNVERIYKELGGKNCTFNYFIQKFNKESRILSQVSWIENNLFFPENWHIRFTDYYVDLLNFQSDFKKNKHDDCADAITIIADCYNEATSTKPAFISDY